MVKALSALKGHPEASFDLAAPLGRLLHPAEPGQWAESLGLVAFALLSGVFVAAVAVARSGAYDEAEVGAER
jgi:hypothetical protein